MGIITLLSIEADFVNGRRTHSTRRYQSGGNIRRFVNQIYETRWTQRPFSRIGSLVTDWNKSFDPLYDDYSEYGTRSNANKVHHVDYDVSFLATSLVVVMSE